MLNFEARYNVEIVAYRQFDVEGDFQEVSVVGKSGFSFKEAEERAFQKLWNFFKIKKDFVNKKQYIYLEPLNE